MQDEVLQWITLNDFSAGIVSRIGLIGNTATAPANLGAATVDNTYRCIALPGGGLGPLPKRTTDLSVTDATPGDTFVVDGFGLFGPMYQSTVVPVFNQGPPGLPFVASTPFEVHLIYDAVLSGVQHSIWRRYRYFSDSGFNTIFDFNVGTPTGKYPPAYTTMSRALPTSPADFGPPVFVVSMGPAIRDATASAGFTAMWPDPAHPTLNAFWQILNLGPVVGHQNRIVQLGRTAFAHGAPNYGYSPTNEFITYTKPNDVVTDSVVTLFGQEYPVGYGAWGSLTSSDLLLIKHMGGAYLIQGDLNSPIVRRMPNVVSTGGVESVGAHTGAGFIYGVNNDGVYAWQGGDGSVNISPQLEDGFWMSPAVQTYLYKGTFLGWGSWVLSPNNYLYDTGMQSWWRLDDPSLATYFIWQRDPINNVVYGARPSFSSADKVYASGFDRTVPASSYSWQSQPFFSSRMEQTEIRQLLLCAQGNGTVTVTVLGLDTGTGNPHVFTINSSSPTYKRINVTVPGTKFQIHIVSNGTIAPIVYEVALGYRTGRHYATE